MTTLAFRQALIVRAPPQKVWEVLADSDLPNRIFGDFAPRRFEPFESDGPARLRAWTRVGLFSVLHDEAPPTFVHEQWVQIDRVCHTGPYRQIRFRREMAPTSLSEFRIDLSLQVVLRWPLLKPALKLGIRSWMKKLAAFVEERIEGADQPRFVPPRTPLNEDALARARAQLLQRTGPDAPWVDRLEAHLRGAEDSELVRIRPFVLADAWGADRDEVLGLLLQAALAGMLELLWDTVCPSCQNGAAQVPVLSDLDARGHCQLCDLSFDLDLDRAVEAIFRPAPAIRPVPTTPFCLANAGRQAQVYSQGYLQPGAPLTLEAPREPGRYRLFVRGGAMAQLQVQPAAPDTLALTLAARPELPSELEIAPGGAVTLTYSGPRALHAKIDRKLEGDLAATAHRLALHPLFRRYFSNDLLKPGLALAISRMSLVFTDLTASTAMYARLGEPRAFRIVLDHFELLRELTERNHGIVVKTIGDAVMAAFADESSATRAALAMVDAFPALAARYPEAEALGLKVGAFTGPCYAVRANGALDYFGQTVNTAARVQGQACSGELLMTREAAERAVNEGLLARERVGAEFEATLKGLPSPLHLVRIPSAHPEARASRSAAGSKD